MDNYSKSTSTGTVPTNTTQTIVEAGPASTVNEAQNAKLQTETLNTFTDILQQFINQIQSVFPECTETKKMSLKFEIGTMLSTNKASKLALKKKMINGWHNKMKSYYDAVTRRDPLVIKQVTESSDTFRSINLWRKWNDPKVHPGTHEVIWKYIDNLNKFCQMYIMYSGIPTKMLSSIEKMASSIATDMQEGNMSGANLADIGRKITNDMDPEEMKQFTTNMMSNMNVITSLCSTMMGGTTGGGSGGGAPGSLSMADMLSKVTSAMSQNMGGRR